MKYSLGVDTGGTYTDAVLLADETTIVASAKSLTTRHDLAVGIGKAVGSVLEKSGVPAGHIGLACLSTTLATNALVEGQGGRVALIFTGFKEKDLGTNGVLDALNGDPVLVASGGHTHAGMEAAPLDETAIAAFLEAHKSDVSAFAVTSQFAVRNPAHEVRIADMVRNVTGKPVSASHQLSAQLGGPKRALTAVLNARLIGMIDQLITRAEGTLSGLGIRAPLMVVRGDGALISAEQARHLPIETILSGPAASLVGAAWITGQADALVSDIGGTTTDVALLRNGRPSLDPKGARVGVHRTMVQAVAMRTAGLGGDSEVHVQSEGLEGGLSLGPRRVVPVSLLSVEDAKSVHDALDEQLRSATPGEYDARFVKRVTRGELIGLTDRDARLLERIGTGIRALDKVLRNRVEHGSLRRLVERGHIQIGGPTPTDASHVTGLASEWDEKAAEKCMQLLARKRTGSGEKLAKSANDMAEMVVLQMHKQTMVTLLETAFSEENAEFDGSPSELARHALVHKGLAGHAGIVRLSAGLNVPIVGLGASAHSYYPKVGEILGTEMILSEFAPVANAIGAVVGKVTMRRTGTMTSPGSGLFRVHMDDGPQDFSDAEKALSRLETSLRQAARADALAAGAQDVAENAHVDIQRAVVEEQETILSATVTVEASGRPEISDPNLRECLN